MPLEAVKKSGLLLHWSMLTFTITYAQCWISIWLVNHSVSECMWRMFGWHAA